MHTAQDWITHLNMQAHPEGGYFAEVYRSPELIPATGLHPRYHGPRNVATSIYFLLTHAQFSAFHRLQSDEGWHYYTGNSPLHVHAIDVSGTLTTHVMGANFHKGERFQAHVPAGSWFASEVTEPNGFALVGCTVAPGFDFADFELAKRDRLVPQFPQYADLISRLTRT